MKAHIIAIVKKKQNTARAQGLNSKSKRQNILGAQPNFLELDMSQKYHSYSILSMLNILKFNQIDTLSEYEKGHD